MEKLKNKKHNHILTKLLKFSIFAIVMLAPFISVASKSIYVAFNKNAKESYYGETINEEIDNYINIENLENGNTYYFQNYTINTPASQQQNRFTYLYVDNVKEITNLINYENDVNYFVYYYSTNNTFICRIYYHNHETQDINISAVNLNFRFKLLNGNNLDNNPFLTENNFFYTIEYNKYSYLDNSFQFAVNQLEEDNLYNWSKNTGIYTAIQAMTSGLGINNVVAMLLAYWSMITCVYIVFDIIIELFIRITHMINAE